MARSDKHGNNRFMHKDDKYGWGEAIHDLKHGTSSQPGEA